MTTIPVLVMLGVRLCVALLTEAQVALDDEDWSYVLDRLLEFKSHIERYMRAESEVLYPKLSALMPESDGALMQLRQEHAEIAALIQQALCGANDRDKARCAHAIGELIELISSHWMSEQSSLYALAEQTESQDHVLRELAEKLGQALDASDEESAASGRVARRRLH